MDWQRNSELDWQRKINMPAEKRAASQSGRELVDVELGALLEMRGTRRSRFLMRAAQQ